MFTLKFFKSFNSGQRIEDVITCYRYEKVFLADGSTVIHVHTELDQPNIEFRVDHEHQNTISYSLAFIENSAGKTIDRIEPLAVVKEAS